MPWAITDAAVVRVLTGAAMELLGGNAVYMLTGVVGKAAKRNNFDIYAAILWEYQIIISDEPFFIIHFVQNMAAILNNFSVQIIALV